MNAGGMNVDMVKEMTEKDRGGGGMILVGQGKQRSKYGGKA